MDEQAKQIAYRDARITGNYDEIWQSVGKCVFCDLRNKYIVAEENGMVLTVSLFAYIDGHLMIIPQRHVRSPKDLTELEWATMRKFTYLAKKLIRKQHGIKAMQLIFKDGAEAQSTVSEHLHFHCVPFDAPDLTVWNYRQLRHTPIENAQAYRDSGKLIAETNARFDKKYRHADALPLACDVLLTNSRGEILFEQRAKTNQIAGNLITPPGGSVWSYDHAPELEAAREILEETGLQIDPSQLQILMSRPSSLVYEHHDPHLNLTYKTPRRFLLNTYTYPQLPDDTVLTPGDDCAGFVWVKALNVANHEHISTDVKAAVATAIAQGRIKP
jgi:diadenosine tetraphosphate (Ap4A) HIT family hydrolase/8-oxo-dGTP pyrophosphatase MutT (NUDIX family)